MATIGARAAAFVLFVLLAFVPSVIAQQKIAPGEVVVAEQGPTEVGNEIAYDSTHDEFLVVWEELSSPARVRGRRMRYDGRGASNTFPVSPATGNDRSAPSIAYDPVHDYFLVVYEYDYYGDGSDIDLRAVFLSWDGVPLTPEQVIADATATEWLSQVAYSSVSQKFLVTWEEVVPAAARKVKGRLIGNPTGESFTIAEAGRHPDVAWQPWGDNFLVVYEREAEDYGSDVAAKVIAAASGLVGLEVTVAGWPDCESIPRVATCENYQYLVVWESATGSCADIVFDTEIYGRFLLGNGSFWGDVLHFAGSSLGEAYPDVACLHGGIDYLVAYEQRTDLGAAGWWGETYAQRLRATGELSPIGFVPMSPPADRRDWHPTVAGNRVGWMVTTGRLDDLVDPPAGDIDIYGRVAWQLFSDSFEWGSTSAWGSHVP